ncbi:MAG: hypothetical protein MN733_19220, partial [Nitrososphaera sp.]|nr:hypothetical protein [Nitrososphaera sp.]
MSALDARLQFKLRALINCLIVVSIFVVWAFLFAGLPFAWVADAVAIGALYYLFFFVLRKRAIRMRCPNCHKHLATNAPWICGDCRKRNDRVDDYPFLNRCEHCGVAPRAYQCHHRACRKLIFLTEDESEQNYAHCVEPVEPPAKDESKEEVLAEEREKRKLNHELVMTELTAKLDEVKRKADFSKKRNPYEKVEEDFERHHAQMMAVHEIARDRKRANVEKYKEDAELLERANESVDAWV